MSENPKATIKRLEMIIKKLSLDNSACMRQMTLYDTETYSSLSVPISKITEGIIVDDRERAVIKFLENTKMIKTLSKSPYHKNGFPHRIEQLHLGDFAISDQICIERKHIDAINNDLWASLIDGRLYAQCTARCANYANNFIVLEIDKSKGPIFDEYFTVEKYRSIKLTVKTVFNHHIEITSGIEGTIDFIYRVWEKVLQAKDYHDPTNKEPRPKTLIDQQKYLLSGLIDVGKKGCAELLNNFKSPFLVFKYILTTKLEYTKGGNFRPLKDGLKGFGPKFIQKNQQLLLGK